MIKFIYHLSTAVPYYPFQSMSIIQAVCGERLGAVQTKLQNAGSRKNRAQRVTQLYGGQLMPSLLTDNNGFNDLGLFLFSQEFLLLVHNSPSSQALTTSFVFYATF